MNSLISTANRDKLKETLIPLKADTQPLWGKMTAQQMAEHLVGVIEFTNGKKSFVCNATEEGGRKFKERMVYLDIEFPKNVVFEAPPENYTYPDLSSTINQLFIELNEFDNYFSIPGATQPHAAGGPMNHEEWLIFHGKHFNHHLKQFGLLT